MYHLSHVFTHLYDQTTHLLDCHCMYYYFNSTSLAKDRSSTLM
jgi:hypothetical protein